MGNDSLYDHQIDGVSLIKASFYVKIISLMFLGNFIAIFSLWSTEIDPKDLSNGRVCRFAVCMNLLFAFCRMKFEV